MDSHFYFRVVCTLNSVSVSALRSSPWINFPSFVSLFIVLLQFPVWWVNGWTVGSPRTSHMTGPSKQLTWRSLEVPGVPGENPASQPAVEAGTWPLTSDHWPSLDRQSESRDPFCFESDSKSRFGESTLDLSVIRVCLKRSWWNLHQLSDNLCHWACNCASCVGFAQITSFTSGSFCRPAHLRG